MIKNILIAIDSFKGSLTSKEANQALANGLLSINPNLNITTVPIGDGGEGSLEAIAQALGGQITTKEATNSQGQAITADYCLKDDQVFIESAQVIGINKLTSSPDAYKDSSAGLGIFLRQILDLKPDKISLTLGGSAINDLGLGMIYELGARFYDKDNQPIEPRGTDSLKEIHTIDLDGLDPRLEEITFELLSDVTNPLTGPHGATYTYGRQKGLKTQDIEAIDKDLQRVASLIEEKTGTQFIKAPMSGAAGGLGFIFMTLFRANASSGIETILDLTNLEEKIRACDLVITGEGKMDTQTYYGKAPIGISDLAKKHQKLCFAITGTNALVDDTSQRHFDYIFNLSNGPMTLEEAMANAKDLMESQGRQVGRIVGMLGSG